MKKDGNVAMTSLETIAMLITFDTTIDPRRISPLKNGCYASYKLPAFAAMRNEIYASRK